MDQATMLRTILARDPLRWRILSLVRSLGLPDCWAAAGFVRNAVWDHLHGRAISPPATDVDVVWFVAGPAAEDGALEAQLRNLDPAIEWSVKNQARMHLRNADPPYVCAEHAMRHWPETATSVGVRLTEQDGVQIAAPYGLGDLFGLIVRPTPRFAGAKLPVFCDRVRGKRWLEQWPMLKLADAEIGAGSPFVSGLVCDSGC